MKDRGIPFSGGESERQVTGCREVIRAVGRH